MKFFGTMLALIIVALFSVQRAQAAAWGFNDRQACSWRSRDAVSAIDKFCSNRNMVVPGPVAGRGATVGAVFIKIAGPCNPKQWVPVKYCYQQFYYMCRHKITEKNYGNKGCQTFGLYNVW